MRTVIVDTCVFIHLVRDTETGKNCLSALQNFDVEPNIIASVVTKAEIQSFIAQNNWGEAKKDKLAKIFDQIIFIDIANADNLLLDAYTHVDAFSKRRVPDKSGNLLSGSAKKMGKNDLWIAATAYALNIPLMTTDGDFDHLNGTLLNVIKVE